MCRCADSTALPMPTILSGRRRICYIALHCAERGTMMKHRSERTRGVLSVTAWWEHRRLVLSLVLCFVVALSVAVALRTYGPRPWSELTLRLSAPASPTPSPALHMTYVASLQTMPPVPLRVGEQATFQWVPNSFGRASAASGPAPVHCTLSFYGPYASEADLNKILNTTSDWTALPGVPCDSSTACESNAESVHYLRASCANLSLGTLYILTSVCQAGGVPDERTAATMSNKS